MKLQKKNNINDPAFSFYNKIIRVFWRFFYVFLFRYSPTPFYIYRVFLLKIFGCRIDYSARIYPSVDIWLPSNLIVGSNSTIGPNAEIYNQGEIIIGNNVIISQNSKLYASTHDYDDPLHPLILGPIHVDDYSWVCACSFIGPKVTLNAGTVVGACSVVMKDTPAWSVVAGNPSVVINKRSELR